MINQIFFSIIIPTYNRADFIKKTIDSFLNQTFNNFEIIIVDDGSTDNTKDVVSKINDNRIRYFYKENAERGAARNYGANKAKGMYLNFFDSDDIAYSNHLQVANEIIQGNIHHKVFALSYDIKNTTCKTIRKTPKFKNINKQLIKGNLLSCNGVFVRNELNVHHPFSEIRDLSASEDYLLWLQLASRYEFKFLNIKTSAIIEHVNRSVLNINPNSLIKRKELMLNKALDDDSIKKYYGNKIKYLKENTNSYISLHLAIAKNKRESFNYYIKSIKIRPLFILTKRSFAIVKRLIF